MSLQSYRGLNLGAQMVSGVARNFKKISFHQPVLDISNNAGGITNEAMNVRLTYRCGLFDLTDKTIINISGTGLYQTLQNIFTNNVYNCSINKTQDTLLLNQEGNILDKPTLINTGNTFKVMCNRSSVPIIKNILKDEKQIKIEDPSNDFDLFALQGSWSMAGINKMYYFLNLDFKELPDKNSEFIVQNDVTVMRKSITGADGFLVSIPKDKTDELFDKLLHQPNIYMTGGDALLVNKMESKMITDLEMNGQYNPIELNQLSLVSTQKNDFIGINSVLDMNNNFRQSKTKLMSTSFDNYNFTKKPINIYNNEHSLIGTLKTVTYSPYLGKFKATCEINSGGDTQFGIMDNKKIELMNIF